MQAYAEGFEILEKSPYSLNFEKIAKLWNQGSVVRSWLLELAEEAFKKDPNLKELAPFVEDSGEGRWTVEQAIEMGVPVPAIASALFARFGSRDENSFALKMLAALRNEFGGHAIPKSTTP
jgi:6-phosphogluconate dehydrogenase